MNESQALDEQFTGSRFRATEAAAMVRRAIDVLGEELPLSQLENEVFHYFMELDESSFVLGGDQYIFAYETLVDKEVGEDGSETELRHQERVLLRDDRDRTDIERDFTVMFPKFQGLEKWYRPSSEWDPSAADVTKGYANANIHDIRSMLFSLIYEK